VKTRSVAVCSRLCGAGIVWNNPRGSSALCHFLQAYFESVHLQNLAESGRYFINVLNNVLTHCNQIEIEYAYIIKSLAVEYSLKPSSVSSRYTYLA
jgi:hypothetical protein